MSDQSTNNGDYNAEAIDLIRRHGEGWEEKWREILSALIGDSCRGNGGPLFNACRLVCNFNPDWTEDFYSYMLGQYIERVHCPDLDPDKKPGKKSKPLFAKYDPQLCSSPVQYLCSYSKLKGDLREFLRKERMWRISLIDKKKRMLRISSIDQKKEEEEWEPEQESTSNDSQKDVDQALSRLKSEFIPIMFGRRGRAGETAGLELYVDLLSFTDQSGATALVELTRRAVASGKNVSGEEPDRLLRQEHDNAQERYEEHLQNLRIKRNKCLGENLTFKKCDEKIQKLVWEHWFCPIGHLPMVDLFAISKEAAYQYIHRYNAEVKRYRDSLKQSEP